MMKRASITTEPNQNVHPCNRNIPLHL